MYTWDIPSKHQIMTPKWPQSPPYMASLAKDKRICWVWVGSQLWEVFRQSIVKEGMVITQSQMLLSPLIRVFRDLVISLFLVQEGRGPYKWYFSYKCKCLLSRIISTQFSELLLYLPFLKNHQLKIILVPARHILGWHSLLPLTLFAVFSPNWPQWFAVNLRHSVAQVYHPSLGFLLQMVFSFCVSLSISKFLLFVTTRFIGTGPILMNSLSWSSAKILFQNKVTFIGSRGWDFNILWDGDTVQLLVVDKCLPM